MQAYRRVLQVLASGITVDPPALPENNEALSAR
jgi:hypothetical protein